MNVLKAEGLTKRYSGFTLDNASFELQKGKITGFIGRNGAGKTTTLKSMLNIVHPDSGKVYFFGKEFAEAEMEIKRRIGFVAGGFNYFLLKKLKAITSVVKNFYPDWDDNAYREYIRLFGLDENKRVAMLSAGMKVKYFLALALSHRAEILILDEPTSGLDPVSRDEILDIFLSLAAEGKTIFFSTHIISDLKRCADRIIYIKNGKIIADDDVENFEAGYRLVYFDTEPAELEKEFIIGLRKERKGFSGLIKAENAQYVSGTIEAADLENIMLHIEREGV